LEPAAASLGRPKHPSRTERQVLDAGAKFGSGQADNPITENNVTSEFPRRKSERFSGLRRGKVYVQSEEPKVGFREAADVGELAAPAGFEGLVWHAALPLGLLVAVGKELPWQVVAGFVIGERGGTNDGADIGEGVTLPRLNRVGNLAVAEPKP
jgi:hypothetical protein